MTKGLTKRLIPALIMAGFAGVAGASGFQLQNQSGAGNGNAFAGAAAAAEDASTIFFNPAGMAYLPRGHNISASVTLLNRNIHFDNKGSGLGTTAPLAPANFPLPTGEGGNAGGLGVLPHGYWAWGLTPALTLGVGVGPTFGNKTEYDFDFVGRNAGYFFEMKQININPSISYKVNETVSLGAGINFAHNESHFKQGVPVVVPAVGYLAGNYLDVKGDDWAIGYNLGAMFQLSPHTRVGIAYRSQLTFDLEGDQKYRFTTPGGGGLPPLANQDIKAQLKTPANFSLAVSQKMSDKWELLGDITWTDWSVVDTLYLKNKNSGAPLHKLPYKFEDTWRIGLGANYQYNNAWKFRFGVAHDKSPIKHTEDRTMTLPDSDRTWLSFGAKYNLSKTASIDFGYAHIFFADAKANRAVKTGYPNAEVTRQVIRGDFKTSVDILSVQYNQTF